MTMITGPAGVAFTLWAIAIAVIDLRTRRIPNGLLLLALVPTLLLQVATGLGMFGTSLSQGLAGAAIGFAVPFAGYLAHVVGAGDVKYLAIIGMLVGSAGILPVLIVSATVLGLLSLAALVLARWRGIAIKKIPAALAFSWGFVLYLAGT